MQITFDDVQSAARRVGADHGTAVVGYACADSGESLALDVPEDPDAEGAS